MRANGQVTSPTTPHPSKVPFMLLDQRDATLVQRFYLSLSPMERQMRFRGVATDPAISAYCARIDWARTLVVAGGQAPGMRAAVHMEAQSAAWERAMLTLACAAGDDDPAGRAWLLADMVQTSVDAAVKRGCGRFAIRMDPLSWSVMPLLAGLPAAEIGTHLAQRVLAGALQTPIQVATAAPARPSLTPA